MMKSNSSKSRERTLAILTVVILAGVLVFWIVVDPQLKRHKALRNQRVQLQLQRTKMHSDLLLKDRIEKVYAGIAPMIRAFGTDQQEISKLTRTLNDLYASRPVKIGSVKILPVTQNEFYRQLSLKIDMSGDIRDVIAFLNAVDASAHPLKVERLSLITKEIKDQVQASFLITKIVATLGSTAPATREVPQK